MKSTLPQPSATPIRSFALRATLVLATLAAAAPALAIQVFPPPYKVTLFGSLQASLAPCSSGAAGDFCLAGSYRGTLHGGRFETQRLSVPRRVGDGTFSFFDGRQVIHLRDGDLFCADEVTQNFSPDSNGEFVDLCKIDSGTEKYRGATGYIQIYGTSLPDGTTDGRYAGELNFPRPPR